MDAPMKIYDAVIVGAGPAGVHAGMLLQSWGLDALLVDEQFAAGGQVWRPKSAAILEAPSTPETSQGNRLRADLKASGLKVRFQTRVWQIERGHDGEWLLGIQDSGRAVMLRTKALILAVGAQERVIPVPGWTLPGVLGLAGATAVMKEHLMVPGKQTVVAGCGPLLIYAAHEVLRLGGQVAALVSLNRRRDWARMMPVMVRNLGMLWRGNRWLFELKRRGVPMHWGHGVVEMTGETRVNGVSISKVDSHWQPKGPVRHLEADSVFLGHGLYPAVEPSRLAGAEHVFDETAGGWIPLIDPDGRTTQPGLYVCGDNAGVLGVGATQPRGRLAALALLEDVLASSDIGAHSKMPSPASLKAMKHREYGKLRKVMRMGKAMTALTIPKRGLLNAMKGKTLVCRCEGVTRDDLERELGFGGVSPNVVKSGTRCGMGACGGRFCLESMSMLTCELTGRSRQELGVPTSRPPLRPMPLGDLAEDINYEDLPIPEVSPL